VLHHRIWEKKYGKNANHVKKQQEQEKEETLAKAYANPGRGRGRGRDGFEGNRGRGGDGQSQFGFGRGGGGGRGGGNANASGGLPPQQSSFARSDDYRPHEKKPYTADKPVHPSWEAKMRLKEKQGAAIVPAQGTRITFK